VKKLTYLTIMVKLRTRPLSKGPSQGAREGLGLPSLVSRTMLPGWEPKIFVRSDAPFIDPSSIGSTKEVRS
jgi:hypothetical protein